ncbi:MAG: hypothetical protein US70_C0006G0020 [Parcubacteria group bacterium GW2011_GWD2_38_11]|nr:MAG: hypothetical protein US70_C0006G0020 [Parcubacteria group bacterium GW2011_GWD2_38_11]
MRTINMVVFGLVSLMLVVILSGCQSKNDKMREFLYRYGNVTIEEAYKKGGFVFTTRNDFQFKIDTLVIKSVKSKEVGDVTYHFVKAKIVYNYNPKVGAVDKCYRWMALTIEEDGFGNMLVDPPKSKEIVSVGLTEKESKKIFPDKFENGENLIK